MNKIALSIVACVGLTGCFSPAKDAALHNPKDNQSIESPYGTLKIVNVLSKELYDDAHIAGSLSVSYESLEDSASQWSKDDTIVLYCSNYQCTASGLGAQLLQELGFTKVYAYEGGMADWYQHSLTDERYQVTGPAQQGYLKKEIPMPTHTEDDITVISAEELLQLITNYTKK